jgi:predicted nucleic acid-binding protein
MHLASRVSRSKTSWQPSHEIPAGCQRARCAGLLGALISKGVPEVASCSITELGFIRVLAQAPQYDVSVEQARILLTRLKVKKTLKVTFVVDDQEVSKLPAWVKTAKQTTDGHLVQVAKAHGAVLATLDRKIPAALVIPPTPGDETAHAS